MAWINPVIAAERMAVLCLYDRRLFDLNELSRASAVHPITTGQAALCWAPGRPLCRRDRQVDATNHDALASVIAPLVDLEESVWA